MKLLFLLLVLTSCSTFGTSRERFVSQVWKGGDGQGNYLAGGMLLYGEVAAGIECRNQRAIACMYSNKLSPWKDTYVEQFYIVIRGDNSFVRFDEKHLEVIVHEGCHYAAAVMSIETDPCHAEDKGTLN